MGELQETIKDKVASYHEDMIEYWKDLVNYQAGSKEAELITALLQKWRTVSPRKALRRQCLIRAAPSPCCGQPWVMIDRENPFFSVVMSIRYSPVGPILINLSVLKTERSMDRAAPT